MAGDLVRGLAVNSRESKVGSVSMFLLTCYQTLAAVVPTHTVYSNDQDYPSNRFVSSSLAPLSLFPSLTTFPHSRLSFVSGASGFLASYIISDLLSHNYTVHGTLRSLSKQDDILSRYPDQRDRLNLFQVKDLVTGEGLEQAMKGCDAVLHTASPCELSSRYPTCNAMRAANPNEVRSV